MDLGTSAFTPVDFVGHNQRGNENEILSHNASSSLSGGSVILTPGMLHQTEIHSMALPSCGTFVSSANNDVFPSNMSGKSASNIKATAGSSLFDPFSVSNGRFEYSLLLSFKPCVHVILIIRSSLLRIPTC